MLARLLFLSFLLFSAGCDLANPEPVIRVAASSFATGIGDVPKEHLFEISSDLRTRRGQFARLTDVLSSSKIGQETPTLLVSMTFCRSHPHLLPEVGGPGATATRWLKIRFMDNGGSELLFGSNEKDAKQIASNRSAANFSRLIEIAAEHLEGSYNDTLSNAK